MKQAIPSATIPSAARKTAGDAVVAGKHGAPLIRDAKLVELHAALLRATPAPQKSKAAAAGKTATAPHRIKFPAVYAALLADLTPRDCVTADIPLHLAPFTLHSPLEVSPAVATGVALGLDHRQPGALVLAFTRAHRLQAESFRQTLRAAARHHAPILYVLLPPPAAPSAPAAASHSDWSARAILEDVPCIPADAHDAVALYRIAQETILRARNHGGPSLIDCKQVQLARGDSNPVARMEAHLRRKGLAPAVRRHAFAKSNSPASKPARTPA